MKRAVLTNLSARLARALLTTLRYRYGLAPVLLAMSLPGTCFSAAEVEPYGATPRGWYLGGGYALTNVFWTEPDSTAGGTSERGDSDSGFIINGGYRFNRFVAVELGYLYGGTPTFSNELLDNTNGLSVIGIDARQETQAVELSGLLILPFWKIWEIYIKLGAAAWDANSTQTIRPPAEPPIHRVIDESGTDFMLGVGGGVTLWDNLHIRLEVQAFRTDDQLLGLDFETVDDLEARFDAFTLEAHWRFGDNWGQ